MLSSQQPVDIADGRHLSGTGPATWMRRVGCCCGPGRSCSSAPRSGSGSDRLAGLLDGTSDYARLGISVVLAHQVSPGYGMPDEQPADAGARLPAGARRVPASRRAHRQPDALRGRRAERSYRDMPANHSSDAWSVRSRFSEVIKAR